MLTAIACILVFLVMASLMYTRRLSALLALPVMAIVISLCGGIPTTDILSEVISKGALKLHNAYTTTMFGAMLAELVNRQGIAKSLIRWVAEFSGDNPFILAALFTAITALLFSTLGGLGAVIMVGTIVLPVMLSLGISSITAGCLFLFGISIGGMFNLSNWQLYIDVLHIDRSQIMSFVLPFAGVMSTIVLTFLALELKQLKNISYLITALFVLVTASALLYNSPQASIVGTTSAITGQNFAFQVPAILFPLLIAYATYRHFRRITNVPGFALFTPFVPLALVLVFHWEIIPAFMAGIVFGVFTCWQHNSINTLTRSILDGVTTVIPAVVLMIGIGMLLSAVMHPQISEAITPLLSHVVPTHSLAYILTFTLLAPLSLYRGPLSLWGMGSGLVALVQRTTALGSQALMGMLMSVGQLQGVCDPTNTHNIWIATYLGTDTQSLLKRAIPYVWLAVFMGLCLSAALGYIPQ